MNNYKTTNMNDNLNSKSICMKRLLQWKQFPQKNFTVSVLFILIALLSGINGWGQIVSAIANSSGNGYLTTTSNVTASVSPTTAVSSGRGVWQAPNYSSSPAGLNFGTKASAGAAGFYQDNSSSYTTASTNNEFITFTITPAAGYTMNVTGTNSISVTAQSSSGSANNYFAVAYSNTASFGSPTVINSSGQALTTTATNYTVSASPTLTATNSNPLQIRIYIYRNNSAASSGQFTITGLSVLGTVTANTYNVTYNGNSNTGGSVPTDATNYSSGATVTVASNSGSLAKTNYNFSGWNTATDGSGSNYTAGSGTFTISNNTTLYANWTGNVTYSGNGSTGGSVPTDATNYESGATVTAASNSGSLVKSGFTFGGWNTATDGSGTNYTAGSGTFNFSGNITLYARWVSSLNVTYNGNGNTGGSVPTDATNYSSGATVTVASNSGSLVKTNYNFSGWNTLANGTGTNYTAGTGTFNISSTTTLYANWTGNVTYSGNGSTGGSVPTDATNYESGATVTAANNTGSLVNAGYTFAGWNTAANGSGTAVAVGATFSFAGNVTLYAQWTVTTYTTTQNGDWNTPSTWTQGVVPTAGIPVIITNAVTVNNDQSAVTDGSVTINTGGSLTFGSSGKLLAGNVVISIGTTLDMTNGGTLSTSGTITATGTFTPGAGTVTLTGTNTWSSAFTFNNLNIPVGVSTIAANFTINGNLTISGTGTYTFSNSSSRTLSVAGNLSITGTGGMNSNSSSSSCTITLSGTSKTMDNTSTASSFTKLNISISGSYTLDGNFDYSSAASTSRSIAVTATGSLNVSSYTLTMGISPLTLATGGAVSLGSSGTINTACVTGAIPTTGTYSGTVTYSAASGGQTIVAANYTNLTISATSGTTTWASSGTVGIAGTLTLGTGTNTNTVTNSTVSFNTGSTTIPAMTYNNLTINNSAGVTLGGNVVVGTSGVLTLTSGVVATSTYTLTVNKTAATAITGESSGSYINGTLAWALPTGASSSTYVFPVGTASDYTPISLVTPTLSAASTLTVTFSNTNPGSGAAYDATLTSVYANALWTISPSGGNITAGTLTVQNANIGNTYTGIASFNGTKYVSFGGSTNGSNIISGSNAISITSGVTGSFGLGVKAGLTDPIVNTPPATNTASSISLSVKANSLNNIVVIVQGATGTPSGAAPSPGNSFAGGTVIFNGTLTNGNSSFTSVNDATTSLSANTLYNYKVYSYDGTSAYSAGASIATSTLVNASDITNPSATSAIGTTTATVTLGGVSPASGTAYSTSGTTGIAYGTSASPTTPTSTTGVLTGLTAQTKYYARQYATTVGGTAYPSGTDFTFTTLSAAPTAQPSSFTATAGASGAVSFSLTSSAATFPSSGATKTGYLIGYVAGSTAPTLNSSINGQAPSTSLFSTSGVSLVSVTEANAPTAPTVSSLTVSPSSAGLYTIIIVPYTYDGSVGSITYNYLTTSAKTATVTVGTSATWFSASETSATAPTIVGSLNSSTTVASVTGLATAYTNAGLLKCYKTGTTWYGDGTGAVTNSNYTGITYGSSATDGTNSLTGDDIRHIDFTVQPSAGKDLTVNAISVPVTYNGTASTMTYSVGYSLDGTHFTTISSASTATATGSYTVSNDLLTFPTTNNEVITTTYTTPISVPNGTTLTVRVIMLRRNTSTNSATYLGLGSVKVVGSTTTSPDPVINSTLTQTGTVGTAISTYTITATNNPTIFSASNLPPGLSINTANGQITGTPTASGTYNVTIGADNGNGDGAQTKTLVYTINAADIPAITSATTATGTVGQPFNYTTTATNSPTSYSATGLPTGVSINSNTGVISGTPSVAGTYSATVNALLSGHGTGSQSVTFTIAAATDYVYGGTGALDAYGSWYAYNGSNGASTVAATSSAIFSNGSILEVRTNASTAGNAGTLTISGSGNIVVGNASIPGVTLTVASGKPISATINVAAASAGTNTLLLQDATIPTFGTLSPGSTVEYGASVAQTITTATYQNLTISNTSASGASNANTSLTSVNGTLTVKIGSILSVGSGTTASTTRIVVGTATVINGTIIFPYTGSFISGTGTFTANAGATIYTASTYGISTSTTAGQSSIENTGTRTLDPGVNYVYNAIAAQNTGNSVSACANLTIQPSSGVTVKLSQALAVSGTLSVNAGTLDLAAYNVTLKSTSITNSAVVDKVLGAITYSGVGRFVVERYIPAKYLGYRDMAPEVYGAGTINANWQEGATNGALNSAASNPHPGYGIFITGSDATYTAASNAGGMDANGFDKSGTKGSLNTQDYTYDPMYTNTTAGYGHFRAFTNTTTTNLDPFTGYRLLIRGDRSPNLYTDQIHEENNDSNYKYMYTATTLRATGKLITGDVTYNTLVGGGVVNAATGGNTAVGLNATVNGFSMVANPYVCPVQWSTVYDASNAASHLGINGSYWYLDPTSSATGKYIAYNASTGSNLTVTATTFIDPITGQSFPTYNSQSLLGNIQAGQAVFVQSLTASPKVVFQEAAKVASSAKTSVFGTATLSKIYVSLWKQANGATTYNRVDGAAVAFRSDFGNTTYGPQDALKLSGTSDNLYISNKGKNLSIDGRLPATASDAIALVISKPSTTSYQLQVDANAYTSNGFAPVLYDAYKNTTKALGTGITTVDVTIDATVAASYSNRFSILFAPSALPVNSIVATASLSNKVATITWNTVGEKSVARYEVEKSTDEKTFTTIGQATAKNTASASYATTDNSVTATTYYRIKAVSTTGATSYSNVAKLTNNKSPLTSYSLYPNPIKGSTLNLAFDNVTSGKYIVNITNALGQKVVTQTISHTGGSATHALTINSALAAGVYNVTISEAGSKQIVHQTNLSVQP